MDDATVYELPGMWKPSDLSGGEADQPEQEYVSRIGVITKNPILRYSVKNPEMAIAETGLSSKEGDVTSFYHLVMFRSLAENGHKTLTRGTRVIVVGWLVGRKILCYTLGPDLRQHGYKAM